MEDPVHSRWVLYSRRFLQLALVVCTTWCLVSTRQGKGSPWLDFTTSYWEVDETWRGTPLVWYADAYLHMWTSIRPSVKLYQRSEFRLLNPIVPLAEYGFAIALPLAIVPIPGRRRTLAVYFSAASGFSLAAAMAYSYYAHWISFEAIKTLEWQLISPHAYVRKPDGTRYFASSLAGALLGCVCAYPLVAYLNQSLHNIRHS